jgi:hypothetical protein
MAAKISFKKSKQKRQKKVGLTVTQISQDKTTAVAHQENLIRI